MQQGLDVRVSHVSITQRHVVLTYESDVRARPASRRGQTGKLNFTPEVCECHKSMWLQSPVVLERPRAIKTARLWNGRVVLA